MERGCWALITPTFVPGLASAAVCLGLGLRIELLVSAGHQPLS